MGTPKPASAASLRRWRLRLLAASRPSGGRPGRPDRLAGPAQVLDGRPWTWTATGRAAGRDRRPDPQQTCRWNGRTIPCGLIAGDALRDLVTGADVQCGSPAPPDGRLVGVCQADGFDIGGNMVYTGWAIAAPDGPPRYRETEAKAKAARRGLWRGEFVMPADWRAGVRLP